LLSSAIAGIAYAVIIFSVGVVLGTIRVLLIAPHVGATIAVLLEAPLMLVASWHVCRQCIKRFRVPTSSQARLSMGAVALAILLSAEIALAGIAFGQTLTGYLISLRSAAGVAGLSAQIAFAALPLLQLDRRHRDAF
jgi:hypothetical protein